MICTDLDLNDRRLRAYNDDTGEELVVFRQHIASIRATFEGAPVLSICTTAGERELFLHHGALSEREWIDLIDAVLGGIRHA